ncbi:MAG TPA: anti-sigma factor [Myxococcales bacterium]|jgi:anti-sigma factor RsiW|nr:anti-sigma factor [Myxococcales bacterium]
MTSRCEETVPLLSPLGDGELAPDDRAWVEEHLAGCESCSARLRFLSAQGAALREHVRARGATRSLDGLAGSVLARIRREKGARRPWDALAVFHADVVRPHRAGIGALALAACLALAFVWQDAGPGPSRQARLALNDAAGTSASIDDLEYDDGSDGAVLQLRGRNGLDGPATTVIWMSDRPSAAQ